MIRHLLLTSALALLCSWPAMAGSLEPAPGAPPERPSFDFYPGPIFDPPVMEPAQARAGEQVLVAVRVGCLQALQAFPLPIADDIWRTVVIAGSTIDITVRASWRSQCVVSPQVFRFRLGTDIPPGTYEVRLFAQYEPFVILPRGTATLQVIAAEPVPTAGRAGLLSLFIVLLVAGLAIARLRA
jgi:hypothetical protein